MARRYQPIAPPSYYLNAKFEPTQEYLGNLGQNILSGNIPDYYADIGEYNSPAFQDVLNSVLAKTKSTIAEQLSAGGNAREGVGADIMARASADITKQMTYDDWLRALEGKAYLFGQGAGLVGDVANRALSESGQRNQFNLGVYNVQEGANQFKFSAREQQKAQEDALLASIIGGALGVGTNIYGINTLGKAMLA